MSTKKYFCFSAALWASGRVWKSPSQQYLVSWNVSILQPSRLGGICKCKWSCLIQVLLVFAVSLACVTSLYYINRDFSTGAAWFEELSYCSHCFHRFQSGKAMVDMGMKYYVSRVPRPLPAFVVVLFPDPSPEVWCFKLYFLSHGVGLYCVRKFTSANPISLTVFVTWGRV